MNHHLKPEYAPSVALELLPSNHQLLTAESCVDNEGKPALLLGLYMPDGAVQCTHRSNDGSNDDDLEERFREYHCDGCDYAFDDYDANSSEIEYINSRTENEAYEVYSASLQSRCSYYRDRDNPEYCERGLWEDYRDQSEGSEHSYSSPPMLFTMLFRLDTEPVATTAELCKVEYSRAVDDDDNDSNEPKAWWTTSTYRAINTYGDGKICWGGNAHPTSLQELARQFLNAPSNDDLLCWDEYDGNMDDVRDDDPDQLIPAADIISSTNQPADAVILVTAQHSLTAWIQLRACGIEPLPPMAGQSSSGFIVLPLWRHTHAVGEALVDGFRTGPIPQADRCWFLIGNATSGEAQLIGQIPYPTTPSTISCESIALSSSAPAALAAT